MSESVELGGLLIGSRDGIVSPSREMLPATHWLLQRMGGYGTRIRRYPLTQ